jgi:hypothetical protein
MIGCCYSSLHRDEEMHLGTGFANMVSHVLALGACRKRQVSVQGCQTSFQRNVRQPQVLERRRGPPLTMHRPNRRRERLQLAWSFFLTM